MNVPEGFKQTEVGVIPKDWDVDEIQNLCAITTGDKNTQDRIVGGEYPFFVRSQIIERINSYSFDGEAVLTAGDGVGTGKIFHYINGRFDFHQRVYKMSNFSSRLSGYYFFQYFRNHFYNRIAQMTAKSSVDSVRKEMIGKMLIPLPPPAEQTAIATALSDMDALIEGVEKLLEKKRRIKQGAMQELLTGRTRLPGYSKNWETKRLGDIVSLCREHIVPSKNPEQVFVHFSLPAFDAVRIPVVEIGAEIKSNKFRVPQYAILVSKLNPRIPRIWTPEEIPANSIASTEFLVLLPSKQTNRKFLHFVCSSPVFCEKMESSATGTTGSHQRMNPKESLNISLYIPSDLSEQTAIAAILSDMDSEIQQLETQLAKYRQLKTGMMQELLTGKKRLV